MRLVLPHYGVIATIFALFSGNTQTLSTKLCRDPLCQEPISIATARRAHRSVDGRLLSFSTRDRIKVLAKHEGENKLIWEGEVDGKRGYFPAVMVEEVEILSADLQSIPTSGVFGDGSSEKETYGDKSTNKDSIDDDNTEKTSDSVVPEREEATVNHEKDLNGGDGKTLSTESDSGGTSNNEQWIDKELLEAQKRVDELTEKQSVIAKADQIGVPLSHDMDRDEIERELDEARERVQELIARKEETKEETKEEENVQEEEMQEETEDVGEESKLEENEDGVRENEDVERGREGESEKEVADGEEEVIDGFLLDKDEEGNDIDHSLRTTEETLEKKATETVTETLSASDFRAERLDHENSEETLSLPPENGDNFLFNSEKEATSKDSAAAEAAATKATDAEALKEDDQRLSTEEGRIKEDTEFAKREEDNTLVPNQETEKNVEDNKETEAATAATFPYEGNSQDGFQGEPEERKDTESSVEDTNYSASVGDNEVGSEQQFGDASSPSDGNDASASEEGKEKSSAEPEASSESSNEKFPSLDIPEANEAKDSDQGENAGGVEVVQKVNSDEELEPAAPIENQSVEPSLSGSPESPSVAPTDPAAEDSDEGLTEVELAKIREEENRLHQQEAERMREQEAEQKKEEAERMENEQMKEEEAEKVKEEEPEEMKEELQQPAEHETGTSMDEYEHLSEESREREEEYLRNLDRAENDREERYRIQLEAHKKKLMESVRRNLHVEFETKRQSIEEKVTNREDLDKELARLEIDRERRLTEEEENRQKHIDAELKQLQIERRNRRAAQLERFRALERERFKDRSKREEEQRQRYDDEMKRYEEESKRSEEVEAARMKEEEEEAEKVPSPSPPTENVPPSPAEHVPSPLSTGEPQEASPPAVEEGSADEERSVNDQESFEEQIEEREEQGGGAGESVSVAEEASAAAQEQEQDASVPAEEDSEAPNESTSSHASAEEEGAHSEKDKGEGEDKEGYEGKTDDKEDELDANGTVEVDGENDSDDATASTSEQAMLSGLVGNTSPLVLIGTIVGGLVTVVIFFCIGKKGPNINEMKKKFEEDLVAAIAEKDNLKSQMEELTRTLGRERQLSAAAKSESQMAQRTSSQLSNKQQSLQEEIKRLTGVTAKVSAELEAERRQSALYQQQASKSSERVAAMQQELNQLGSQLTSTRISEQQLKSDLNALRLLEEQLKGDLEASKSRIQAVEEERVQALLDKESLTAQYQRADESLTATLKNVSQLERHLKEKENEIDVLRDCIEQLNAIQPPEDAAELGEEDEALAIEKLKQEKFKELSDVAKITRQLKVATAERAQYLDSFEKEQVARLTLQERVVQLDAELNRERETFTASQKELSQSNAKLEALSEYLKEKESLLQRQLGKEELEKAVFATKEQSAADRAAAAERDMATMRRQMAEIEKNLMNQVSINEKRAQEALARLQTTERELRLANDEITSLRRRLTSEMEIRRSPPLHGPFPPYGPPPPPEMMGIPRSPPVHRRGPPGPGMPPSGMPPPFGPRGPPPLHPNAYPPPSLSRRSSSNVDGGRPSGGSRPTSRGPPGEPAVSSHKMLHQSLPLTGPYGGSSGIQSLPRPGSVGPMTSSPAKPDPSDGPGVPLQQTHERPPSVASSHGSEPPPPAHHPPNTDQWPLAFKPQPPAPRASVPLSRLPMPNPRPPPMYGPGPPQPRYTLAAPHSIPRFGVPSTDRRDPDFPDV